MIKVFKTEEEFDALRDNWAELLCISSTATPYQSWEYNRITWQIWHKPEERLYIICYQRKSGKQYDAILPCYIDGDRRLHLIDYMSDFCDGIIPDRLLECYDMYFEISKFVHKSTDISSVCFKELRQNSRLMAYLYVFGAYSKIHAITGYPLVRMHKSYDDSDFVDSLVGCNSNHRCKLRKILKDNGSFNIQLYNHPEKYPEDEIRQLADFMVSEGLRTRKYLSNDFLEYFSTLYNTGLVYVVMLYENTTVCCCSFILNDKRANEYIKWVVLYRNGKFNTILNLLLMDYMYNNDVKNLNFARGVYAYKLNKYHPSVYTLHQLEIFGSRREANIFALKMLLRRMKLYALRKLHCL